MRRVRRPAGSDRFGAHAAASLELVVEVLRTGRPQSIVARGGSMQAAIPDGSRLTLAAVHDRRGRVVRRPKLGEVVAVSNAVVGLVVHRVVGVDASGRLLIKGDACPNPDGWFTLDDVVAVVDDVEGRPVPRPMRPPPRWRRGLRRIGSWLTGRGPSAGRLPG